MSSLTGFGATIPVSCEYSDAERFGEVDVDAGRGHRHDLAIDDVERELL
jgi:hypothetical protein